MLLRLHQISLQSTEQKRWGYDMNLLEETKDILKENGKTLKDIVAVQGNVFGIPVEKFIEIANVEYDDGYGGTEVADDLIVLGDDWWLERHEYDGSEWWEYKEMPKVLPTVDYVYALTIGESKIHGLGDKTLEMLNER